MQKSLNLYLCLFLNDVLIKAIFSGAVSGGIIIIIIIITWKMFPSYINLLGLYQLIYAKKAIVGGLRLLFFIAIKNLLAIIYADLYLAVVLSVSYAFRIFSYI